MVILWTLWACGGSGDTGTTATTAQDPCEPGPAPTLVVGKGDAAFTPLEATDPVLELVHGPQGGYHVVLGLEATEIDASQPVSVHLQGEMDGELVAETWPVASFRCNDDAGALQAWDLLLIMVDGIEPVDVHGGWLDITATVTDVAGASVSGTAGATVLDPELE